MNEQPPVNDLSGKDVVDFGKEVGRDTFKQTLVWTLSAFGTKILRSVVDSVTKPKSQSKPADGEW